MRPIVASILLLLLLLQVSYRGLIFSSYFANKAYIAAVLCENRNRPELECEGKCYLKKELRKANAPESNANGLTLKLEVSPFMAPVLNWNEPVWAATVGAAFCNLGESTYRYSYHPACFHPPRV